MNLVWMSSGIPEWWCGRVGLSRSGESGVRSGGRWVDTTGMSHPWAGGTLVVSHTGWPVRFMLVGSGPAGHSLHNPGWV